jgi:muramoyltetrapeptide carboxypeptidase
MNSNHPQTIGIFATSSPVSSKRKPKTYRYLKSKGYQIWEHPTVRTVTGHTAGTIQDRVDALHEMLKNDELDILMAFWGGANTNQLLPYLDYGLFRKYEKPIIGFSDTSALLLAVMKESGITTYMGPSAVTFTKPDPFEYTFDYFEKALSTSETINIADSPEYADDLYFLRKDSDHRIFKKNPGRQVFRQGKTTGKIVASNLQTLMVLAGTKYFPDLTDKVLFIEEDENTNTQMIHRFFTHLSQVVDVNSLAAVCVGRFAEQSGFDDDDSEMMIYEDVFADFEGPFVYNLDFGHTDPMFTIPLGWTASIDTGEEAITFMKK